MRAALLQVVLVILVLATASTILRGQTDSRTTPATGAQTTADDCGCDQAPEVLATVNGQDITRQGLTANQARIKTLHEEVSDARKKELDLRINSQLLEAAAKKRGTSVNQLLQQEVFAKVPEPTEAEAQTFYSQNKERIPGDFAAVKAEILNYLRAQRQEDEAKLLADRFRAAAEIKLSGLVVTPPAKEADRARIFATVNGKNITSANIEDGLRSRIFSVQQEVFTLRKAELDQKINDTLLVAEAARRSVSTKDLLAAEVTAKLPMITEADAQKFYDENKSRVKGEFVSLKPQIVEYLQSKAKSAQEQKFADELRRSATIRIFLSPPVAPVFTIAIDDQPARGNPNAKVTLVEFTDFQCAACNQGRAVLDLLLSEFGSRVQFVVRDYPLSQHENSFGAAEAAEAAREQGKYWEYAALLLRNHAALQPEKLKEYATSLQLDRARFDNALATGKFKDKVERDLHDGLDLGVNATPTWFVNGRKITDLSYAGLKAQIEAALKEVSSPAAKLP